MMCNITSLHMYCRERKHTGWSCGNIKTNFQHAPKICNLYVKICKLSCTGLDVQPGDVKF